MVGRTFSGGVSIGDRGKVKGRKAGNGGDTYIIGDIEVQNFVA